MKAANSMKMTQSMLTEWLLRAVNPSGAQSLADTRIAIGTELGIVRDENQDKAIGLGFDHAGEPVLMAAISDGMGGLEDGGVCAALALSAFIAYCTNHRNNKNFPKLLVQAAHSANELVFELYQGKGGATLSVVFCSRGHIYGLNVGDSRIYQLIDGRLKQVTTDDTLAGQLARPEESGFSEAGLLQFIGCGEGLSPHLLEIDNFDQGLLITSDGAHYLPHSITTNVVKLAPNPIAVVRRLLAISKWCSGHDNASAAFISPNFQFPDFQLQGHARVWDSFGELVFAVEGEEENPKAHGSKFHSNEIEKSEALKSDSRNTKTRSKKKLKSRSATKKVPAVEVGPELHVDLFGEGKE